MSLLSKRIATLEDKSEPSGIRHFVQGWGNALPVSLPPGVREDDKDVLVIRRVIIDPPVRDALGNITRPAQAWDDDDPRYAPLMADAKRGYSALGLAVAGARDTLALKLAQIDANSEAEPA